MNHELGYNIMMRYLLLMVVMMIYTPVMAALTYGVRPFYLIEDMNEGELKAKLQSCAAQTPKRSLFSIGHRGVPMQFPEHTKESYIAAAQSGAGIIECDVTFTKDKQLVCRHSQSDLHTTTNILLTPLADKCSEPFRPAQFDSDGNLIEPAAAMCRTSDITLAEFKTLKGKMDGFNPKATTPEEYVQGTPSWRTDNYAQNGTLMSFKESIALFEALGVAHTPELKSADVPMPFNGFSQADYAQKMIDELKQAGVPADKVYVQSFDLADIRYWIAREPAFGRQAVFLDENLDGAARIAMMPKLKAEGVNYIGAAIALLLQAKNGKIVASDYAHAANQAGIKLIAWSLERSGPLATGGGWYYTGVNDLIKKDGDMYQVLHVLANDARVVGVFSDWPATTTYYANCFGL